MFVDYFKNERQFVEFNRDDVIFEQGDEGDAMYVIKAGTVAIYVDDVLVETLSATHYFGEMSLVDRVPRAARAVASSDCKLVKIDKRRFLFLVQETPTFAIQVMHELSERIRRLTLQTAL